MPVKPNRTNASYEAGSLGKTVGGLLAAVIVTALSAAAHAQAPAYSWTGPYIGLNAGYGWGNSNVKTSTEFSPVGYFATTSVTSINHAGSGDLSPSGFVGGLQGGFNWQIGYFVLGGEADFEYFPLEDSRTVGPITYPCCAPTAYRLTQKVETDWLFTARPRLGLAFDNWLLYVTGGMAVTNVETRFHFTDTFATANASGSDSDTKVGWTLGGGVEFGITRNWSVRAEYLYVDFGTVSFNSHNLTAFTPSIAFPANQFKHSADLQTHIARAAVNFRF